MCPKNKAKVLIEYLQLQTNFQTNQNYLTASKIKFSTSKHDIFLIL